MPKLKLHRGAKKRFKLTANGKLLRRHAASNHFLAKKSPALKRLYAKKPNLTHRSKKNMRRALGV